MKNLEKIKQKYTDFKSFYMSVLNNKNEFFTKESIKLIPELQFLKEGSKLVQYCWHYYNNILEIPKCTFCDSPSKLLYTPTIKDNIIYQDICGSKKCIQLKRERTMTKLYGTKNIMQNPKYVRSGKDNPFAKEEVKQKIKQTNLEKYGVEYPLQNKQVKQKLIKTNLEKYGVTWNSKAECVKNKKEETFLNHYGVKTNLIDPEFKNKIKQTILEKYDVENVSQNQEIKDKVIEKKIQNNYDKYENILNGSNCELISVNHTAEGIKLKFKCLKCGEISEANYEFIQQRVRKIHVTPCLHCLPFKPLFSQAELDIIDFLKANNVTNIVHSDRTVLRPKEIDVYLPDYNIGIEYNGIYWHSDKFLEPNYHQKKKIEASEKGINLINIWEDQWLDPVKNKIIKSRLLNVLHKTPITIYGRKTIIKNIDNKLAFSFCEKNHIQGGVYSTYNYGLYYNGELVSVMTFGRRLWNFELLRFCNRLNTNVIGGFSKLFKNFLNLNISDNILSYGDLDWSDINNNVYKTNGFNFESITIPGYFWVNEMGRINRQKTQKKMLIKAGYSKDKTETEIMEELGYEKIFNDGNLKYRFKKG